MTDSTISAFTGRSVDPALLRRFKLATRILAVSVVLLGSGVMLGWWLNVTVLPGLGSMKFNTATCFVLAGLALLALSQDRPAYFRLARASGVLVAAVGVVTLSQYVFGWDSGIDQWLFDPQRVLDESSGRMSPITAICFVLCGSSLAAGKGRISGWVRSYGAVIAGFLSLLAIYGYLFEVSALYRFLLYNSMAIHTAVGFCLLATGIVLTQSPFRLMARVTALGTSVALTALLAHSWVAIAQLNLLSEADRWERHSLMVISELDQLWVAMLDAETSQRGFVISGDESHLSIYEQAVQKIHENFATLKKLTAYNPSQTNRLAALEVPLREKLAGMERNGRLRRTQGFAAAQVSVQDLWEHGYMNQIRMGISDVRTEEQRLLDQRTGNKVTDANRMVQTLATGGAMATLTLLVIFTFLLRESSRRQRSETALQVSEARLRIFIEHAPAALAMFDTDMRYVAVSRRWLRDYGLKLEELIGRSHYDIFPEIPVHWKAIHRRALAGEALHAEGDRFDRADGTTQWLNWEVLPWNNNAGVVGGIIVLSEDVTERTLAKTALAEHEQHLALAVFGANLGTWTREISTGLISASARTLELFGFAPHESVGLERFFERIYPDDRAGLQAALNQAITGQTDYRQEYRVVWPDNSVHWISSAGRIITQTGSNAARFLAGVVMDITEHRKSEEELQCHRAHLESMVAERTQELQKINAELCARKEDAESVSSAKSEFLSHMSHEIRTPMNAILGTVQVLERSALDDDQRHLIRTIRSAGRGLLAVINDVLDLSKVEAGHFQLAHSPFVLNDVMSNLVDLLTANAAEKGLRLTLAPLPDGIGALLGDSQRLTQVLYNLTGNAIKFTASGGVTVVVRLLQQDAGQLILRFAVRDTGIGIAPAQTERLFDAFAQANTSISRQYGGTGLGLAISRQLVTLMGGEIGVDSQPGEGSEFWFVVPFESTVAIPMVEACLPVPHIARTRLDSLRVLVVDDNTVNQETARRLLELEGARVDVAHDGSEAVDRLRQAPSNYDLVLMDVQMPVMDGLQASRLIRSELGQTDLPIIALTAGALPAQRDRAFAAGMNDFLNKPFELDTMVATILHQAGAKVIPAAAQTARSAAPLPAVHDFPAIPGINSHDAVQRLRGDKALFFRSLRNLRDEFAETPDQTREDLARGDTETAARRMHKLRGTAGTVSAERVTSVAGALEETLRSGARESVDETLASLESALAEIIDGLPSELDEPINVPDAAAAQELNLDDVTQLIAELAAQSMDARQYFRLLRPGLAARHDANEIVRLAESIEMLSFSAAEACLRSWYPQHDGNEKRGGEGSDPLAHAL